MNINDAIIVGKVSLVLADAYFSLEQFEKSLFYSKKAIEVCKEDSDDKYLIMKSLLLIASNKMELELYNDAIQYANKCIEAAKETGDRQMESQSQLIKGRAYIDLCQYDTALSYFTEGLEIAEQLADEDLVKEFKMLLSNIHITVGIKGIELSEARECCKHSENARQLLELISVAQKFESQGEYGRALSVCEQAEKLVEQQSTEYRIKMDIATMNCLLGNHNIALRLYHKILCYSKEAKDKLLESQCRYAMSKVFFVRGALKPAENCIREAIDCFETMFHFLGKNDKFEIAFVDKYILYYETLTALLLMTRRYKEALINLDCYRARALKSQLIINYGMKEDLHEESRIQFTEIESLISNNKYTIVQYFACEYRKSLVVFLLECGSDLIVVEQPLQNCSEYLEKCVENAFTEMNVCHVTCENRCLNVGEETTDDKKVQSEDTGIEEKLEILLNRTGARSLEFRSPENKQPSENVDESSLNSALEILYSKLLRNVMPLIKQEEIVFLPDGPLFKIPFAALRDPETGRYLSEMKRIRIAPSISTLKILNDRPADFYCKRGALIIGDPLVGKVIFDGQEREITPLFMAYIEALAISKLFYVELLSREKATKAAVLEKLHQGVSVVHIAAHGDVQKATILLAPSPEVRATKIPDEEDYVLTMDDVQNSQVRAKLVVLSCCQSGRGEIRAEGVVGMCRAFLAAGASAVVASLWAIDDDATQSIFVLITAYQYKLYAMLSYNTYRFYDFALAFKILLAYEYGSK
ncbi:hypothetical protein QZH41_007891 [Actinostola sp. cb2023]|nr:hypothetical protein QZH41_007891 [Actinostola sp. cb2023]